MNKQIADKMWELLPEEEKEELRKEFGCTSKATWTEFTIIYPLTDEGELLKEKAEKIINEKETK